MNVFDKAIDEIKTRGWAKTTLIDDEGKVCLLGACALAAGYDEIDLHRDADVRDAAYSDYRYEPILLKVINDDFGHDVSSSYVFNDRKAQNIHDVIAVLEKASVRESEKV